MSIQVLSDNMISLVAAGEVVERPASIVKELIENSIDAGAKNITVEIKNGGKKLIQVSDDGMGIPRNDIRLAFISHATSKISKESDLEKILTLGFRGEALASVSVISKIDFITYFKNESCGTHYKIDGGEEIFLKDCAQRKGSSISVRDIFYNTPARMKFLKQDITEGNFIASIINRVILSHPEIAFKFIRNNKNVISSIGDGKISSSVLRVFGKEFFENLIEIDYSTHTSCIKGFIGNPNLRAAKSKIQNFFLNGRWIKSKIISDAIEFALENECQNTKVPAVLYIKIPPELVDVNVHPAKTEVRFASEKLIFELVYNAVKDSVIMNRKTFFTIINNTKDELPYQKNNFLNDNILVPELKGNVIENIPDKSDDATNVQIFKSLPVAEKSHENNKMDKLTYEINNRKENQQEKTTVEQCSFLNDEIKIIGEVFNCFLIFEYKSNLILIDKHAAHERIIFENFNNNNKTVANSQVLISSVVIDLPIEECELILNNLVNMKKIGYEIENFGPGKLVVREIPAYLEKQDIKDSICKISDFLSKNKSGVKFDDLKKIYAQIACKSAIKSGKASFSEEIKSLIKSLISSGVTNCPHGRPIYISVSKNDIYKKFLRK